MQFSLCLLCEPVWIPAAISDKIVENIRQTCSQRLIKCICTCLHNSFLKDKRASIKDHIISVYSFYSSCCQRYKTINKLQPFGEFCLNPSVFQMRSLYSLCNSIFGVPEYALVCDLKNHINMKASNFQKPLFTGLLSFGVFGRWGFGIPFSLKQA